MLKVKFVSKNPSEIATEFVLHHCALLHQEGWLGSRIAAPPVGNGSLIDRLRDLVPLTQRTAERLASLDSFVDLLQYYQLKGVREDSRLGLLGWLQGEYPLELRLVIPSPREMLKLQCEGRRVATLLLGEDQQFTPIDRHPGAYEFLLHDLEHAHKFFGGEFRGQRRFFQLLSEALQAGFFSSFMHDQRFAGELDYLMSDMNSHPVHLLKYLKAIVLSALQRANLSGKELNQWSAGLFDLWNLPDEARTAAMKVNFPEVETKTDLERVSRFFGV